VTTETPGTEDALSATAPAIVSLYASHLMRTTFDLGLPDEIGDEPEPVPQLAERVGADPAALRGLTHLGMFRPAGDDRYAATQLSTLMRTNDSSTGLGALANEGWMWQCEGESPAGCLQVDQALQLGAGCQSRGMLGSAHGGRFPIPGCAALRGGARRPPRREWTVCGPLKMRAAHRGNSLGTVWFPVRGTVLLVVQVQM
jgi:hypothetical protein